METTKYIRVSIFENLQKLYTEFSLCPLSFCLWLDSVSSVFKSHLDHKSKKTFYSHRVPEFKRMRHPCNITQPIRATSNKEFFRENKNF